jgi:hypothetical protein
VNIRAIQGARNTGMNTPKSLRNDDPDFDPEELASAADETPTNVTPPELNDDTRELTTWDEAPASAGGAAPKVLPEDEVSAAEQLVYEGTDEADRERRMAAADPDFEP